MLMSNFRFRWSILGIAIGLAYYGFATLGDFDGFESFSGALMNWEHIELDELFVAMLAILMFFLIDCMSLVQERKHEKQRMDTYHATLETTHHILNNFLNQAQILELAVEEDPKFDPEIIEMYHQTVKEATEQLAQLDHLSSVEPDNIRSAVYPSSSWVVQSQSS